MKNLFFNSGLKQHALLLNYPGQIPFGFACVMSRLNSRILLYSHDTYGLGHLRRTLAIAGQIAQDLETARQLIITGSMVAGAFGLPPNLDLIKLPALTKRSDGRYRPRALPLSLNEVIGWREAMILQAVQTFEPDLMLVDKAPAGVQGELMPTLRYLRTWMPSTRLVLGMRDIEDDAPTTLAEWEETGARELHENVYDSILYYGSRRIFDPVYEYRMEPRASAKLIECGYLGRAPVSRAPQSVRRELNAVDRPLIVVTAGGGGDGFQLVTSFLDAYVSDKELEGTVALVVTGPLMPPDKRKMLAGVAPSDGLTLLEFTPDLVSYMAAADLVVSMAGYNTVCEVLSLGVRSLLVPRVHPRSEQRVRAERLAARGLARMLLPGDLSPERLAMEVKNALKNQPPHVTLDLDGLVRTRRAIAGMLESSIALGPLERSQPLRVPAG